MLIEKLNFNKKIDPISDILQWKERNEGAPIIVWGAGSVAYGVLSKLLRSNICIDEVVIDSLSCRVDERIKKVTLLYALGMRLGKNIIKLQY